MQRLSCTGSSSLKRHDCKTKIKAKNGSVTKITNFATRTVPKAAIHQLNSDITAGLAKDLQPLYRVEGEGLVFIAQSLINFGAKFGSHSVKEIVQHRTTLKRTHLPQIREGVQRDIRLSLKKAPSYPKLSFSKDMWYKKYQSNDFISLTVHFIDDNWELQRPTLGMEEFDEQKTIDNIRIECKKMLGTYIEESDIDY